MINQSNNKNKVLTWEEINESIDYAMVHFYGLKKESDTWEESHE